MSKRLENLEIRQDKFLELLEVFVNENWKDLGTYDSFGQGFIDNLPKFNENQSA